MVTELTYRDPALPVEQRAADLLGRMTLEEKVAQLGSFWAFELVADDGLRRHRLHELLGEGVGEITRLSGSTNLRLEQAAEVHNEIQRYLVEETRLGIPAIVHEESLHGVLAWSAPSFQQSIGAAATFDPELIGRVAAVIRRRLLAIGARHALAPVLDLARDPRWGRVEETYGEDPYLAASMGVAYVRALQGPDPAADGASEAPLIMATGKHLAGHGLAEGGLNMAPVHVGWRELRDEQLLPFEAAIREAGLATVMPAYCEIDGVPCHMSRELLGDLLRNEWGFTGLVASDYFGIEQIVNQHRLTDDMAEAAALALTAGVDLELPGAKAYREPLLRAVSSGRVSEEALDACVGRVLEAKFRLGLFENPYVEPISPTLLADLRAEEELVGRELARRSLVMVENDGSLPIAEGRSIAVIGPLADSARDLLGDYSHPLHIQTLLEIRNAFGVRADDLVSLADEISGRSTILDALRGRFGGAVLGHAAGGTISGASDEEIDEAVELAGRADVAVLFLGERSGLTDDSTTGEFRDRLGLGLLGRQQELLEAVVASGTPVVLVVISGRPLALEWAARHCAAVLLAWVPGDEGPAAIAEVLAGDQGPGGKLPVSMPRDVGQLPLTYRHHPSGGRSNPKGDYVDGPVAPLWRFGHGLSYTSFWLAGLRTSASEIRTEGGQLTVSLNVTNVGQRAGDEVVQLYFRDEQAQVARPVLSLCGFRRLHLEPGETAVVSFALEAEQFAFTGVGYRRIVEPGTIRLFAGRSSADLSLEACVTLTGPLVELPRRQRFITPATVLRS